MLRGNSKSIIIRALAFASTLGLSLTIVNALPSIRRQRQRSFAEATLDGNLGRMQLLHAFGAGINRRGNCCLPLFLAAGQGNIEVVRYLLDHDADVNAREKFDYTPLTEAVYYRHPIVARELLQRGADVNAITEGGTALDVAFDREYSDLIELLKHYGARRACELRHCG